MVCFSIYPTGTEIAQELAHDIDELGYFLRRLSEENADALGEELAESMPDEQVTAIVAWLLNLADAIENSNRMPGMEGLK